MKSFALSLLAYCALLLNTAEAAKKGRSATKSAKSKGHAHKSKAHANKGGHGKKASHAAKKGAKHTGTKKAGKTKSATKKAGASGRAQKAHGSAAKKTNHAARKGGTGKGAVNKKASATHAAAKRHHFNPKRAGPTRGHLEKRNNALNARRERAFGRLTPAQRKRAEAGLADARKRALNARRPRNAAFGARKVSFKPLPPARFRAGFRLPAGPARAALLGGLAKSTVAGERNLANRILNNRSLTPANRQLLNTLLRRELAAANRNRPLVHALRYGWRADLSRRFLGRALNGLVRRGVGGPVYLVNPGGTLEAPLFTGPNGISFVPPPGFDPSSRAVFSPEDENSPNGLAVVSSIDPGSLGWSNAAPNGDEDSEGETDVDQPTADSVWQTTRLLKVANATSEKIKVFLRYEAQDENGEWQTYPDESQGARTLVYEVEPGEVCRLKDGDWDIRARRVHIWAEGGGKKWVRYKTRELSLVPEPDDGYAAPRTQALSVAFR